MTRLTKYKQETIINFNVAESDAVVFTRDKGTMKKLDALVNEFPEVYKCIGETDIDKTYSMPINSMLVIVSREGYLRM